MANLLDHHFSSEAASPSMSKNEDNLSNNDGPLIRKRDHDHNIKNNTYDTSEYRHRRKEQYISNGTDENSKGKHNVQCLWSLTIILGVIGICNLILSITVIIVLRVSQRMESLEVIPSESLVKFYGNTDLDCVYLKSGICEGFGDEPVHLLGDNGGINVDIKSRIRGKTRSKFQVKPNGSIVFEVNSFEMKQTQKSDAFFSTNFPTFGLPNGVGNLQVRITRTHRIVAPINENLLIEANKTSISGGEGASLEAKDIVWTANNDIIVNSKNGNVLFDAKKGIDMKGIPVVQEHLFSHSSLKGQYKLCICMPQGKLFKVPVKSGTNINCAKISFATEHDPCL